MDSMGCKNGSFALSIQRVLWQASAAGVGERTLWAHVQFVGPVADVTTLWFQADDENAFTPLVELQLEQQATERFSTTGQFQYEQGSKAIELTKDNLVMLINSFLHVTLYSGSTRTKAGDQCLGEKRIALVDAVMNERVQVCHWFETTTTLPSVEGEVVEPIVERIAVDLDVACDAELADFALGSRVLRLHSISLLNPPVEWTPQQIVEDEDAERFCDAADKNVANYELDLRIPDFDPLTRTPTMSQVLISGGKLSYERASNSASVSSIDGEESAPAKLRGKWRVSFPPHHVTRMYTQDVRDALIEFLRVQKHFSAVLKRSTSEAGRAQDVVTVPLQLNVTPLMSPGKTRATCRARPRKINPIPKESIEQDLAAASNNDEKKRLQALLNDYESVVQQAAQVSTSMRKAATEVLADFEIIKTPLMPEPPAELTPASSIAQLVTPRDLTEEREQLNDSFSELKAELRRLLLTLLQEYDGNFAAGAALARDEKKTKLIFKLNTQGLYHDFKEKLKKRIIPVIRDRFARPDDATDMVLPGEDNQNQDEPVNSRKKVYFGKLYTYLMDEVNSALYDSFLTDGEPLDKTAAAMQDRPANEAQAILNELWLKALENDANGDVEKSERMHLDRIAFAENLQMSALSSKSTEDLVTVWFDYAKFCLHLGDVDKAGSTLRQCLAIDPHALVPVLMFTSLLCELEDFAQVEQFAKLGVRLASSSRVQTRGNTTSADAAVNMIVAHGLLAYYYAQSGRDRTGNLVLFELLRAQKTLVRDVPTMNNACLTSVWLFTARKTHEWHLRSVTRVLTQLASSFRKPRDYLTVEERVLRRILESDVLADTDQAVDPTKLLREALELDADHAMAWFALGKLYVRQENAVDTAIECFRRSLQNKQRLRVEQRLELGMQLGLVLLQASQYIAAKDVFVQACIEFPVASNWLGAGIAGLRLEEWEVARMALAEANRLDHTNQEVWGYLALLALTSTNSVGPREEEDARRCIEQALRYNLQNPVLLRELSNAFVAIDRLEEAEKLLRRSLMFQDSSLTRKTLADVLAAQNCAEEALVQYKSSLEENPDINERCELLEKSAKLLTTLGRPEEAQEFRRMALQLDQFQTRANVSTTLGNGGASTEQLAAGAVENGVGE